MGPLSYFWDSYAVIELLKGNAAFAGYSDDPIKITIFNLEEIYWFAVHEYDEAKANEIFDRLKGCVVELDDETLKEAIQLRKKVYKTRKISYADAIGYTYALRHHMRFLTGDNEFKGMQHVEFVQ